MSVRIVGVEAHLDPYFSWLPPERARRRRGDFFRVFEEAVEYAVREGAHLFLLPGDVFDRVNPRNAALARFASDLVRLRDGSVRVFAVPRHHDRPKYARDPSPLRIFHEAGLLKLFDRLDRIEGDYVEADGLRVWVGGLGYNPYLDPGQDPLAEAAVPERRPDADLTILMTHNTIRGFPAYSPGDPVVDPASIPRWADLVVAGHLHQHLVRRVGGITVCYVGTAERLSFAEEDQDKGFAVIEADRDEIRVEQVRTSARPMKTLRVPVPEEGDLTELILGELERAAQATPRDALVRLKLEGAMTLEVHSTYRRSEIIRAGNRIFFGVNLDDGDVEYVGSFDAPHVELETPLKELERVYRERRSSADEEDRAILEEAYRRAREALEEAGGW